MNFYKYYITYNYFDLNYLDNIYLVKIVFITNQVITLVKKNMKTIFLIFLLNQKL